MTAYAVVWRRALSGHTEADGDAYVMEWPVQREPGCELSLYRGPFATLAEAQAAVLLVTAGRVKP